MEYNNSYTPINQWAEDDRPREKLLLKGRQALSDAELIAILIATGSKNESAVDLSKRILKTANDNLLELARRSVNELMQIKGIGQAKAITIIAALEIGRRRSSAEPQQRMQISSSNDAYLALVDVLADHDHEHFWVLLLNRANKVVFRSSISEGTSTGTMVDIKRIIKLALDWKAEGIILGHNHPSGNIKPSASDINLTQRIKNASSFFDLHLLDHIVVGDNVYYSFADEGSL
ncbi:MAG TPA: hypothetical protein DEO70_13330 [Bacteroidales bacterium]|nr:MAG: hypothetical protein A2X11_09175 [Bacteroidetes bacterium GWE2_42_24]OFY26859.1 MAG: hypothetical protein A2X09_11130 [Bacteroidetes bacterium GWF2_43_11]PKP27249.1 MAG: hypothetical protein CVU06_02825 [Bacteroidetes bacterium HGW-Bacteroidetes-22]HBZ67810.1 hypothetical protein [Bacteroidales bacterium]